ncbi:hypothetical protein PIB30_102979 [Stylosanthes scabra]|uniref:Uncharacterized protein n=1 Tax=Stylosanthes scabra TaxID=79078 RepID=A0ABU6ZWK3_9FABA|nr:hypothetical protein [Stylosanthes scabra]
MRLLYEKEKMMMVVSGLQGGVTTVSHQNRRCAIGNPPWVRVPSPITRYLDILLCELTACRISLLPSQFPTTAVSLLKFCHVGAAVRTGVMAESRDRMVVTTKLELAATNAGANVNRSLRCSHSCGVGNAR